MLYFQEITRNGTNFENKVDRRLGLLFRKLRTNPPELEDRCAWMLLQRAFREMQEASCPAVFEAKANALVILVRYGWRDVFKESLKDGQFKSEEEAGRFEFCLEKAPIYAAQN